MLNSITLVTGGSSGLGLEIARKHVLAGDNVCIVSRDLVRLKKAKDSLIPLNGAITIMALQCNVSKETEVTSVFSYLLKKGYVVKRLYNVAGMGIFCAPALVNREMVDEVLSASFIGLILMSTYGLRAMEEQGGTIVNVMSSAAKRANPMEAVYCGVKWGARGYTESLAAAMKGTPIRVLAVYPGGMNTPFWSEKTGIPQNIDTYMDPAEVAEVIYSAVSDRSSLKVSEISIERK